MALVAEADEESVERAIVNSDQDFGSGSRNRNRRADQRAGVNTLNETSVFVLVKAVAVVNCAWAPLVSMSANAVAKSVRTVMAQSPGVKSQERLKKGSPTVTFRGAPSQADSV